MTDFVNQQIERIFELIEAYKTDKLSLNRLISNLDSILFLDEMKNINSAVGEYVAVLEEINGYLLDGGQDKEGSYKEVEKFIAKIEKVLTTIVETSR